ncbi:FISUMP domain-containing protein [Pseudofulvibacter geojedonensis]|uniref:FISUMP domain-containing protein n=1 Tax=Pseudofulvibacter geojedonensis TaxID=1123758 RepID=A0ABW3I750_9FLAO
MKKTIQFIGLCSLLIIFSCSSNDDSDSSAQNQFTDSRDGQTYQTVKIGNQTWFAENLNYNTEDNFSTCYDDNQSNCFTYGRLYHGDTAQTICPPGWHLPSTNEWQELFDFLGGINVAHNFIAPGATQQGELINFNLLAGGQKFIAFHDLTLTGHYWTSTDAGLPNSFKNMTYKVNESVTLSGGSSASIMKSCRCVKD